MHCKLIRTSALFSLIDLDMLITVLQFSDMKFELVVIHSLFIFVAELICLIDHTYLLIEICFQFNR